MNTSKITQLKTLRIKNECAEYFKDKPLNRYVEWLCEEMKAGRIEERDGELGVIYKYNTWRYERACRKAGVDSELLFQNMIKELEGTSKK